MRRVYLLGAVFGLWLCACLPVGSVEQTGADGGADAGRDGGATTTGAIGDACSTPADCGDGLACHLGLPGGYCISQCWDGCPAGSTCTSFGGQQWCLAQCESDAQCREGYACRGGTCQPGCFTDADCSSGESCEAGSCVAGGIGAPCSSPSDCAEGLSCAPSLPGGYCTRSCEGDPCPEGTQCVAFGGSSYCFDGCLTNADCRPGYACSGGICDVACSADEECGGGEICLNGACVGAGVGQSCDTGGDCPGSLSCFKSVPGGYCTQSCTTGGDCPEGSTCGLIKGNSLCLAACRDDLDCGSGQRCMGGVCNLPCGSDADCAADEFCDQFSGLCKSRISGGGDVEVLPLGQVSLGTTQSIDVDASTYAFTILVRGGLNASFVVDSLRGPSGQELVSRDYFSGPFRTYPTAQAYAAQFPNSDQLGVQPGRYTFRVLSDRDSSADITLYLKKSNGGTYAGGSIPLNVFIAPGAFPDGANAASASGSRWVSDVLARWQQFYRNQASVELGQVKFFDLPSGLTDVSSESEYQQAFLDHGRDGALNLFFVRSLSLGGSSAVAGVSGGIPGPPGIGGTRNSGVIIEVQDSPRLTGDDMCHEIGHFLGLYHISETDGTTHDLITDTPECTGRIENCTTGYYYLMFPALTPYMDTLSPGQAYVVQGNAGIR
ncbi:MAG: hypothetical protein D6729_10635 [Deltaproteobacteria bacterium]|nr:MAG: hypothetical protein D6729_10635 [Deltaproteobacteria bacterium]